MESQTVIPIVFFSIFIVCTILVIGIKVIRIKWFVLKLQRINQAMFLTLIFCLVVFIQYIQDTEASLYNLLVSSITAPQLISLLPLFYFVLKVPTKDDLNKLGDEIKELRNDFKEHMKQYHQK